MYLFDIEITLVEIKVYLCYDKDFREFIDGIMSLFHGSKTIVRG